MRTRCYCTNEKCPRATQSYMRRVGAQLYAPCVECGSPCQPTRRLAGGQPSNRTHVLWLRVSEDVYKWLGRYIPGTPTAATVAAELLEKLYNQETTKKGKRQ